MNNTDPIVITGMARTPQGNLLGAFKELSAVDLGAAAISAAIKRSQLTPEHIEECIMGCVLSAGQGQAPARQAAIKAGIPVSAHATTINKMCGSAMKSVMLAHDTLKMENSNIIAAGGMESMTAAPYLIPRARHGYRLGHTQIYDHMFLDGFEDVYDKGKLMGYFAEITAQKYQFTREDQDKFAIASLTRAQQAIANGWFQAEITPVTVTTRTEDTIVTVDENPLKANIGKIPQLRPAFHSEGTITAAKSSSISDGAAALVLMHLSTAQTLGLDPLAKIIAHASHSQDPAWFTTAPVGAIEKVLKKAGWNKDDVDLYEINEAFAVVTMAVMKELALGYDKVNIHGGACALGHPIGASGARILITLISALRQNNLNKGVAAICIGGGEATAIAVETQFN